VKIYRNPTTNWLMPAVKEVFGDPEAVAWWLGLIWWAMRPHANYKLLLLITRSKVLVVAPQCFRRSFSCFDARQRRWGVSQLSPVLKDVIHLADSAIVTLLFHQDPYCETQTVHHRTWSIDEMISGPTSQHTTHGRTRQSSRPHRSRRN